MILTTREADDAFDMMILGLKSYSIPLATQCAKPGHRARFIAMLRQVAQSMEDEI